MSKTIIAVSGGFDPLHGGHLRLFREAKKYGDKLVVIMNNDNWLMKKKGFVFMKQDEREDILRSIRYVDDVIVTNHIKDCEDMSVCKELEKLNPNIFANGGDRFEWNIPEVNVCRRNNIRLLFNIGGTKTNSSTELVKKYMREHII